MILIFSIYVYIVLGFAPKNLPQFVQWPAIASVFPYKQYNQAEEHASKMCIVCNTIVALRHEKLDQGISYYK